MSPYDPRTELQANIRHSYWDVAWFGVLSGTTIGFINVYAAVLGATNFEIGLLSAVPAVINLLFTLPAGRWLEGRSLLPVSFWSSVAQRTGYLALVFLPMLLASGSQVRGLVLLTLLMSIPGTVLAIAFNAVFAEVIPADRRAEVVGRRNALVAVTVTLSALASGLILDRVVFPLNYQLVFAIGAAGALMSSYHLGRMRKAGVSGWQWIGRGRAPVLAKKTAPKPLLRLDLLRGPFGVFMLSYLAFYTFQYLPFPLFPNQFVDEIGLTEGQISLGSAAFHASMMLGSLGLRRLSRRWSSRKMLAAGGLLFAQYPLLVGLARDPLLYWVASIVGGVIFSVLNGGLINRLMERAPEDDRPAHMALHNLALNLGILIGSLGGPLLGEWLGIREALVASAGLRMLAGLLLIFWG